MQSQSIPNVRIFLNLDHNKPKHRRLSIKFPSISTLCPILTGNKTRFILSFIPNQLYVDFRGNQT